jgi:cysteine desulfurase
VGTPDWKRTTVSLRLIAVRTVYLDYNATTPLDPAVREAMLPFLDEIWGNPSSVHHVGRRARAFLDEFRERLTAVFRCKPSEVVFTSGGTESNNLAILGVARLQRGKGRHLITSPVEHHAVLHCFQELERNEGFHVTYLPVDREGRVHPDSLRHAIRPDTILVSVMAANNEIGTIQPVSELGSICRDNGIVFHTDAVQWFGKENFNDIGQFNADLVSICAHKFHGPKGAGALYIRSPLQPKSMALGGAHENERRAGTENLPAICGLVTATERFVPTPVFKRDHLEPKKRSIESLCRSISRCQVVSPQTECLSNTVAMVVPGADSITLLANLDLEGICASSGSACAAGSLEASHVISALDLPDNLSNSLVRFSAGRDTTMDDIEHLGGVLAEVVERSTTSR